VAPFLSHLVVGERVWATLAAKAAPGLRRRQAQNGYGAFLFGCLAPDVDKFCPGLEQATTHFLPKDEGYAYAWQRSQVFLKQPDRFLRAPFRALPEDERAFVWGYLCHIAADEIAARRAQALESQAQASNTPLPSVDAVLTAMDPRLWAWAIDAEGIIQALAGAPIPVGTLVFAPVDCLRAMHQIILPQVREGGGVEPYLRMVRRHQHWLHQGRVSDSTADLRLEAELSELGSRIRADLAASERLMDEASLDRFLQDAAAHSVERIGSLQAREEVA
jgi:hypothetical protein